MGYYIWQTCSCLASYNKRQKADTLLDNLTLAAHNVNRLRVEIVFESCGLHVDIVVCLANP